MFRVNCHPPSSDSLAQYSFLHFKLRKNLKWFFINLIATVILASDFSILNDTYSSVLIWICSLNMCYYVVSSIGLYFRIVKLDYDSTRHDYNTIVQQRQPPSSLVRYFENHSLKFLYRYWELFDHIVLSLRHYRLKSIGQNVEQFKLANELRKLGLSLKQGHLASVENERNRDDFPYGFDFWLKYGRKTLVGQNQLDKYWKEYSDATRNELVRYSSVNFDSRGRKECGKLDARDGDRSCQVPVSPILSRLKYQTAYDPDVTEIPRDAGSPTYADLFTALRSHHKEKNFNPSLWVTNLRSWLSAKINEVVQQLDAANELLKSCGVMDVRIGESDVSCLRSVFRTHQLLQSYLPLLDFLTLTHEQGYLLWRYRVLASDGCMRHFSWNSGGFYRGNYRGESREDYRGTWNSSMGPNDSEVVFHFFSSYLDMKLPCYPSHSTCKRPFSDIYVVLNPNKNTRPYTNLAIFQQWASPPHFNIIEGGNHLEMPRGSNNLFLAISYLLFCIKTYHKGKIGRVSLGKHGLNLLWIVGDSSHP